jgi:hypothetical protein
MIEQYYPKKESLEGFVSWKKGYTSLFLLVFLQYFLDVVLENT